MPNVTAIYEKLLSSIQFFWVLKNEFLCLKRFIPTKLLKTGYLFNTNTLTC